ncbi:MAG: 50S ribosomal protein L5 [Candidatus Hepatoplasma vulgare]|nr:MAG: 50S ribosomal protein L5 [Candidatus Hepatoplasma sp.]
MINSRLYNKYIYDIRPSIKEDLKFSSIMEVPRISKIVINMGLGEATNDKSVITDAVKEMAAITGQIAIPTIAKKSNASFKIREGMAIGVKVTLRKEKMYEFLDKLISVSLPRIRDFRGIKAKSFDKNGNFSLGIKEYIIFPEIELDKVRHMKGCDITIVTSSKSVEANYQLLLRMGMPFNNIDRGEK